MKIKGGRLEILKDFKTVLTFSLVTSYRSSPKYFLLRVFMNIISIVVPFLSISVTAGIVNTLTEAENRQADFYGFLVLMIAILSINIISKLMDKVTIYCEGMHRDVLNQFNRGQIIKKVAGIQVSFFDSTAFYNDLNEANANAHLVSYAAFQGMDLIKSFFQMLIAFGYLASFNIFYAVILTIAGIPNVIFQIKLLERIYAFKLDNLSHERKIYYISGMATQKGYAKDVRLYGLTGFIIEKFNTLFNDWFKEKREITYKNTIVLCVVCMLPEIVSVLILFSLGYQVIQGDLAIGSYIYFSGIISQLLGSLFVVINELSELNDARTKIKNYLNLLNSESNKESGGCRPVPEGLLTIEFCDVSFAYPGMTSKVLDHVSFRITSKEKVALVGTNGSGKTTIIKLLLRFYDPTEGEIKLNSVNIKEYDLTSLRSCFSALFQDYCTYAFTVKESVKIANLQEQGADSKVEDALEKSGAMEFVKEFPMGVDTYLTRAYEDEGEELSGGQWQKVALARTFYREAPVYILDEPSAALDAEAEDELFKNFEKLYQDKGAILVSHRLSNVVHTDVIIVIDNGKLIEMGSHRELMNRNGKYAQMFHLQADKYAEK